MQSINGVNVTQMTSSQAVAEIAKTGDMLSLVLLERTHSHGMLSARPPHVHCCAVFCCTVL